MLDKNLVENILDNRWHISLTTFRKNGQGVSTPVWFVLKDGKLLLLTERKAWKVKRIRNNPNVEFAPSKFGGEVVGKRVRGIARFINGEEAQEANRLMKRKYLLWYYVLIHIIRRGDYIYFEITPTEVLD